MRNVSLKKINLYLFVFLVIVKVLTYILEDLGFESIGFLFLGALSSLIVGYGIVWGNSFGFVVKKPQYFYKETLTMIILFITYAIFTVYYIITNHGTFDSHMISGFYHLLFPIIVSILLLNWHSNIEIYQVVKISFFVVFFSYIVYRVIFVGALKIEYWQGGVSFINSYAPYESTFFSYWAIAFFLFFNRIRSNKVILLLSVIFVGLTFKRFLIVATIGGLVFQKFLNEDKRLSKLGRYLLLLLMLLLTLVWISLSMGYLNEMFYRFFGINFSGFTMSRAYFLNYLVMTGFKSYGFNSSKSVLLDSLGQWSIEMDIPMVYVEMGMIPVIVTVICIWSLMRYNRYGMYVVMVTFIQLLTSAWFDYYFYWIFMFLLLGILEKEDKGDLSIKNSFTSNNSFKIRRIKWKR